MDIVQEPGDPYGNDEDVARLVFYPNGALPGPIQLRFKSDHLYTYAGIEGELHLYCIDSDEYVEEDGDIDLVFDGTGKWCYATFTHNSEFLVSLAELPSAAAMRRRLILAMALVRLRGLAWPAPRSRHAVSPSRFPGGGAANSCALYS